MELDKFHIAYGAFGAIHHGYSVAGGNKRVGGSGVNGTDTTGGHEGDTSKELANAAVVEIEHVRSVASDVGCTSCNNLAQMVLGYYLNGKMMLKMVMLGLFFTALMRLC